MFCIAVTVENLHLITDSFNFQALAGIRSTSVDLRESPLLQTVSFRTAGVACWSLLQLVNLLN